MRILSAFMRRAAACIEARVHPAGHADHPARQLAAWLRKKAEPHPVVGPLGGTEDGWWYDPWRKP